MYKVNHYQQYFDSQKPETTHMFTENIHKLSYSFYNGTFSAAKMNDSKLHVTWINLGT